MNKIKDTINKMSIRERKEGTYEGRITVNGKRKSFYGQTKAEVKNKAREYLQKVENGYREPKKITLNDYMEYWLATYKYGKIEPSSYARLYSVYINQIRDSIGRKMIGDIQTSDIQMLINEHAAPHDSAVKPLAMSGLKKLLQLLHPCFKMAIQEGVLTTNPVEGVLLPSESYIQVQTKEQYSLTDVEIEKLQEVIRGDWERIRAYSSRHIPVLLLMLHTGLRIGEMLALEWTDIDMTNQIIHINKTLQCNIRNYHDEDTPVWYSRVKQGAKTRSGKRLIPMNEDIYQLLELIREYDRKHDIKSPYVACTSTGTRNSARNMQRSLDILVKVAGLSRRPSLHTLRHTFGSTMLRRGVGIEVVSELMGHANTTITYNKYIHVIQEEKVKAMRLASISGVKVG